MTIVAPIISLYHRCRSHLILMGDKMRYIKFYCDYSDVTWTPCIFISPATQMRVHHFVQVDIKANIRVPHLKLLWRTFTGIQRDCNVESVSISGYHVMYLVKPTSCSTWHIALYDTTALQTYVCVSVLWPIDMSRGIQGFKSKYWNGAHEMSMTNSNIHRFGNSIFSPTFVKVTLLSSLVTPRPVFCFLLRVSPCFARPITRRVN